MDTLDSLKRKSGVIYVGISDSEENMQGRKAAHQRDKEASGTMFFARTGNMFLRENEFIKFFKDRGQAQLNKHERSGAPEASGFIYIIVGTSPLLAAAAEKVGGAALPVGRAAGPLKKDGTPDMRFAANRGAAAQPARVSCAGPLKKDGTPDMRFAANRR